MFKVSVVIASFNKRDYILDAIRSVEVQTFGDLEIVVVDDASNDDTVELLNRYNCKVPLSVYSKNKNLGVSAAINDGILYSSGEYIVLLDADDMLHPGCIKRLVSHMDKHPKCGAVYSNCHYTDKKGLRLAHRPKRKEPHGGHAPMNKRKVIKRLGRIPGTGSLFRRQALYEVNMFNGDIRVQDNQIAIKFALSPWEAHKVFDYLWSYRLTPTSLSRRNPDARFQIDANIATAELTKGHPDHWECMCRAVLLCANGGEGRDNPDLWRYALDAIPVKWWNWGMCRLWCKLQYWNFTHRAKR